MKIQMTVFSVDSIPVTQAITMPDGTVAQATLQGRRIQLVGEPHGTFQINRVGAQAADWATPAGSDVTVTIE